MRRFVIPTAIAAVLLSSPMVMAAENATGTIKAIDLKAMTVTLDNGTAYMLPKNFKNPGLKDGEKVQISWAMENGKHVASDVKVLK